MSGLPNRARALSEMGAMRMKPRRSGFRVFGAGLLGLLLCSGIASAQAVVLTTRSATELAEHVEILTKSAGLADEQVGETILNVLKQIKSGAILKGLDRGRGLGFALSFPKDFPNGGPPTAVLAVPISDLASFMDSLKDLGLTVDDQPGVPGFSHQVSAPNGNPTIFVLQSKGYAICSPLPAAAETLRAIEPSSWAPKGGPAKALSLVVRLSEFPEQVKQLILNNMEAQTAKDRERRPGEQEREYRGRIAGQNVAHDFFNCIVLQAKEIVLNLDLDQKVSQLSLEASINALPNTSLEKALKALTSRRSRFQSMALESAAAAWGSFSIPTEFRDLLVRGLEEQFKDTADRCQPPRRRSYSLASPNSSRPR